MKNLKIFYFILLAICTSFIGCSDDDSEKKNIDDIINVSGKKQSLSNGYVLLNDNASDDTYKYVDLFLYSPDLDRFNPKNNASLHNKNADIISILIKVDDFNDFSPNEYNNFSIPDVDISSVTEAMVIYALDINLKKLLSDMEEGVTSEELLKLKYIRSGKLTVTRSNNENYEIKFSGKDIRNNAISFNYSGSLPTYKASEIDDVDIPGNLSLDAIKNFIKF